MLTGPFLATQSEASLEDIHRVGRRKEGKKLRKEQELKSRMEDKGKDK